MSPRRTPVAVFDQFRGIYHRRIPTYSIPLMLEVAASYGVTEEAVLWNTGLDSEDVRRDSTLISFLQCYKIVRNIVRGSKVDDIGLRVGESYHISTFGVLGYAMMSCANWEEATHLAGDCYQVASSLVQLELVDDRDNNSLSYIAQPYYPDLKDIEIFTLEKQFASMIAVTSSVLPKPLYPKSVSFTYSEPPWSERYAQVFRCPVAFGATENRFEMSLEMLRTPLLASNAVGAEMGRAMCQQLLEKYSREGGSLQRKVSDILLSHPGQMPDMEAVSVELGISSRTLRRQLEAEDTNFQTVFDQVRHDVAKRYLQKSQLNLDTIAELIGFTESTNFRRAFKRWEGVPPAQYRRQFTRDQSIS
jgi:AraC-like DNA-binding protein